MRWVVGTHDGLVGSEGEAWLLGREVTALAPDADGWWSLADGHDVVRFRDGAVETVASIEEELGRCVLPVADGVLVGTANARLAIAHAGSVEMSASFDDAKGQESWYTPWGGPPDTRSLSAGPDGALFANVHVGGVLRAEDPDGTWQPTIDIDADVHQVLADPTGPGHVVAATARGLAESLDGGDTWRFTSDGLHAPYARAVALDGERLFLSASTGPRGGRAAIYRREAGSDAFVMAHASLPEWFAGNIDTHCLAAAGGTVIFGVEDGRAFLSEDGGESWRQVLGGSSPVTCVGAGAA